MHIYEIDGKKLPSVTTIVHCLGDDNLMRWSNSLGFRHIKYDAEMERTSSFGTLVHSHLQSIVDPDNAEPLNPRNSIEGHDLEIIKTDFMNFISKYEYKTIFTEHTIKSVELGYAGTLDWLTYIGPYLCLMDFKTSKAPRFNMYLQLGGYYNLLKTEGYDIDYAAIITANINGCKMHPINKESLLYFSEAFHQLSVYFNNTFEKEIGINYDLTEILTTH